MRKLLLSALAFVAASLAGLGVYAACKVGNPTIANDDARDCTFAPNNSQFCSLQKTTTWNIPYAGPNTPEIFAVEATGTKYLTGSDGLQNYYKYCWP